MPLDTGLLYGEMFGAWILHFAIPFGVSMLVPFLFPFVSGFSQLLIFLGVCALFSFIIHVCLLLFLQAASCGGVKEYGKVFGGSALGTLIFTGMIAIPTFIESMRLLFSQLFLNHYPLLTPELEVQMKSIVAAATGATCTAAAAAPATKLGLSKPDFEIQTFQEIAFGASYWGAFGGAYGVGIGSFYSNRCPPSTP